jgi:hypothetical protein
VRLTAGKRSYEHNRRSGIGNFGRDATGQVAEEQAPEPEQIVSAVNSVMTLLAAISLRQRLAGAQITVALYLGLNEAASPGTIVSRLPAELWIDAAKRKR